MYMTFKHRESEKKLSSSQDVILTNQTSLPVSRLRQEIVNTGLGSVNLPI